MSSPGLDTNVPVNPPLPRLAVVAPAPECCTHAEHLQSKQQPPLGPAGIAPSPPPYQLLLAKTDSYLRQQILAGTLVDSSIIRVHVLASNGNKILAGKNISLHPIDTSPTPIVHYGSADVLEDGDSPSSSSSLPIVQKFSTDLDEAKMKIQAFEAQNQRIRSEIHQQATHIRESVIGNQGLWDRNHKLEQHLERKQEKFGAIKYRLDAMHSLLVQIVPTVGREQEKLGALTDRLDAMHSLLVQIVPMVERSANAASETPSTVKTTNEDESLTAGLEPIEDRVRRDLSRSKCHVVFEQVASPLEQPQPQQEPEPANSASKSASRSSTLTVPHPSIFSIMEEGLDPHEVPTPAKLPPTVKTASAQKMLMNRNLRPTFKAAEELQCPSRNMSNPKIPDIQVHSTWKIPHHQEDGTAALEVRSPWKPQAQNGEIVSAREISEDRQPQYTSSPSTNRLPRTPDAKASSTQRIPNNQQAQITSKRHDYPSPRSQFTTASPAQRPSPSRIQQGTVDGDWETVEVRKKASRTSHPQLALPLMGNLQGPKSDLGGSMKDRGKSLDSMPDIPEDDKAVRPELNSKEPTVANKCISPKAAPNGSKSDKAQYPETSMEKSAKDQSQSRDPFSDIPKRNRNEQHSKESTRQSTSDIPKGDRTEQHLMDPAGCKSEWREPISATPDEDVAGRPAPDLQESMRTKAQSLNIVPKISKSTKVKQPAPRLINSMILKDESLETISEIKGVEQCTRAKESLKDNGELQDVPQGILAVVSPSCLEAANEGEVNPEDRDLTQAIQLASIPPKSKSMRKKEGRKAAKVLQNQADEDEKAMQLAQAVNAKFEAENCPSATYVKEMRTRSWTWLNRDTDVGHNQASFAERAVARALQIPAVLNRSELFDRVSHLYDILLWNIIRFGYTSHWGPFLKHLEELDHVAEALSARKQLQDPSLPAIDPKFLFDLVHHRALVWSLLLGRCEHGPERIKLSLLPEERHETAAILSRFWECINDKYLRSSFVHDLSLAVRRCHLPRHIHHICQSLGVATRAANENSRRDILAGRVILDSPQDQILKDIFDFEPAPLPVSSSIGLNIQEAPLVDLHADAPTWQKTIINQWLTADLIIETPLGSVLDPEDHSAEAIICENNSDRNILTDPIAGETSTTVRDLLTTPGTTQSSENFDSIDDLWLSDCSQIQEGFSLDSDIHRRFRITQ